MGKKESLLKEKHTFKPAFADWEPPVYTKDKSIIGDWKGPLWDWEGPGGITKTKPKKKRAKRRKK